MRSFRISTSSICLFCEDIREELRGTSTLVGVFTDTADIPSVPAVMSKLGIYFRITFPPTTAPSKISTALYLSWQDDPFNFGEASNETLEQAVSNAISEDQDIVSLTFATTISPFNIPQAGRIIAATSIDGRVIRAGSLKFRVDSAAAN